METAFSIYVSDTYWVEILVAPNRPNEGKNGFLLYNKGRASLQFVRVYLSALTPNAHNLTKLTISKPPVNQRSLKIDPDPI
jgi:hypothetical protein